MVIFAQYGLQMDKYQMRVPTFEHVNVWDSDGFGHMQMLSVTF